MSTSSRRQCRNGDRCAPRTLGEAIYCLILHSDVDAKTIAEHLGVRHGYLLDAANPDREDVQFQARHIDPASEKTRNDALINFICRQRGGVFVRIPSLDNDDALELTKAHLEVMREMGEDAAKMQEILRDGKLTQREADTFSEEIDETITKLLEWKAIVRAHVGRKF